MPRPRTGTAPATTPNLLGSIAVRNALATRPPDAWFTGDEAAIYLDCARRTLRNRITKREIVPDGRDGRAPLFRRRTLDAYLEARAKGPS